MFIGLAVAILNFCCYNRFRWVSHFDLFLVQPIQQVSHFECLLVQPIQQCQPFWIFCLSKAIPDFIVQAGRVWNTNNAKNTVEIQVEFSCERIKITFYGTFLLFSSEIFASGGGDLCYISKYRPNRRKEWKISYLFMNLFLIVTPISSNLTEIQCICKLDFGKVLWNGQYLNIGQKEERSGTFNICSWIYFLL